VNLAAGKPAKALLLGRDLHWLSLREPEREALPAELLVAAYESLGRPKLAAIAAAHGAEPQLGSVGIYPHRPQK